MRLPLSLGTWRRPWGMHSDVVNLPIKVVAFPTTPNDVAQFRRSCGVRVGCAEKCDLCAQALILV